MVETGNPKNIKSVNDLADNPTSRSWSCAPRFRAARVAQEIFKKAGVTVKPVSEETSVGGVVTKVTLGEADAGMVYVTDVKANGDKASGVPIPADQNAIHRLPDRTAQGRAERHRSEGVHRATCSGPRARRCWPASASCRRRELGWTSRSSRSTRWWRCLAALAVLFFVFPLIGLLTGAPWGHIDRA